MTLTLSDMFCGAGGSSTGAAQIPGVTVRVAANHWDLAIDERTGLHVCPCGVRGTEAEWERHVADKVADVIGDVPVQEPLMGTVL